MGLFASLLNAAVVTATLAAAAPASRFTYYDLTTPLAAPCDLYTGPDGKSPEHRLFVKLQPSYDDVSGSILTLFSRRNLRLNIHR